MDGKKIYTIFFGKIKFSKIWNFFVGLPIICHAFFLFSSHFVFGFRFIFQLDFVFFIVLFIFFIGFRLSVFPIYTFTLSIFPQQRKLTGSSAQNSSSVHWCRRRRRVRFNEVPEKVPKGTEKIWEALVQSQVTFNRVPEMRNIFTSPFTLRDSLKTLPCRYAFRWTSDKR